MTRLVLSLCLAALLALPATAAAAPGPTRIVLEEAGEPAEVVDANGNGLLDAGDYQAIRGSLLVVSSSVPGTSAGSRGTLEGRIVWLREGVASIRVLLRLPGTVVAVLGTAPLAEDSFTLRAFGLGGPLTRRSGTAHVEPTEGGATITLRL